MPRSVRTSATNSIEILVQIAHGLVRACEPPSRERAKSEPRVTDRTLLVRSTDIYRFREFCTESRNKIRSSTCAEFII